MRHFNHCAGALRPKLDLIIPFVSHVNHGVGVVRRILSVPSRRIVSGSGTGIAVSTIYFVRIVSTPHTTCRIDGLRLTVVGLAVAGVHAILNSVRLSRVLSRHSDVGSHLLHVISRTAGP